MDIHNEHLEIYKVVSITEIANLVGKDRTTVRQAVRKNLKDIADYRLSGGTLLVSLSAAATIYPQLMAQVDQITKFENENKIWEGINEHR